MPRPALAALPAATSFPRVTESAPTRVAESRPAHPAAARLLPIAMMLLLGTLWGLNFSLAKLGRTGGVPPMAHTFWQATCGGLILLAVCWARGVRPRLGRRFLAYYLFAGVIGFAAPNANMVVALLQVPAGVMAVLITLVPVFTYALAIVIGMERFSAVRAVGVGFGLAGALLILVPSASLPSPEMVGAALIGLMTPLFYAIGNVGMARWRPQGPGGDSMSLACGMTLAGGAAMFVAMLVTGQGYVLGQDGWQLRDWALTGQIMVTAVSFVVFFELLRMVGPVVTGVVAFIITCAGILWGMAIFGESHSAWVWAAVVLVLIGLGLVNRPTPAPAASEKELPL
jgi:drug/metabolite transporter (DMT)-like permease